VRLVFTLGLVWVRRGKFKRTTITDGTVDRPSDLVHRIFVAAGPNRLWVADVTYVSTWQGICYVAIVIDVFGRMIVG
jgi:putative transposase